jgi:hypothetical protein
LHDILQNIPAATTIYPPTMYFQQIGDIVGNLYGEVMRGCIFITDGSLHALEKDERAQSNYFYDEHHLDYNGWKSCYKKKRLYFFCIDGMIV